MPTYTFPKVYASREKSGKCPTCGKRTVRRWSDYMTLSPFNKNPDGSVRSLDEVRAAIDAKADAWVPDFQHAKCRDAEALSGPAGAARTEETP